MVDKEPIEVSQAVQGMEDMNLLKDTSSRRSSLYELTEKGFDVAHTRS